MEEDTESPSKLSLTKKLSLTEKVEFLNRKIEELWLVNWYFLAMVGELEAHCSGW